MKHQEYSLGQYDQPIFGQSWIPESEPHAVIALIHGLGEHSGRYGTHFAEHFTNKGVAVFAIDLPGHGKSPGIRGHIKDENEIIWCITLLIQKCRQEHPQSPIFLYGHSLGGSFVLWYAINNSNGIKAAIVTSPAVKTFEPVPALKYLIAKGINKIYPSLLLNNGLNQEYLSHEKQIIKDYQDDPLVHAYVSARLGLVSLEKGLYILENAAKIKCPVLLMVGENEKIVDPEAVDELSRKIVGVKYKVWPGLYHEIHNEPQKKEVLDFACKWIFEQAG